MEFEPARGSNANCKDGYVGPEGRPLWESYGSPGALPACNPNDKNNELKKNVGRYLAQPYPYTYPYPYPYP